MKQQLNSSEKGSAGTKFLIVAVVLILIGYAGLNYVPIAYEGASIREEMDSAVVRGLAASGSIKPLETVQASVQHILKQYAVPADAVVEVKQQGTYVTARIAYNKKVSMLPFGIYKYDYAFDYMAKPTGFLLKDN